MSTSHVARLHSGMFTSATDEWATPRSFFDMLDAEFGFTLDVCASADNAKCARYYSPDDDGLTLPWEGVCWMNPPYGRAIGTWVQRAYEMAVAGATVVCLIPARTDTAYWHDYVMKADEVRMVRGRLQFGGTLPDKGNSAPFPSAVIVFRPIRSGAVPTLAAQERSA